MAELKESQIFFKKKKNSGENVKNPTFLQCCANAVLGRNAKTTASYFPQVYSCIYSFEAVRSRASSSAL